MDKVKAVLFWIKTNPVSVVCVLVVVLAGVSFYWPSYTWASSFRKEMYSRSSEVSKISSLVGTKMEVPGKGKDDPPQEISAVINQPSIEVLTQIYDQIGGQYDGVYEFVWQYNKGTLFTEQGQVDHVIMKEQLFPEPTAEIDRFQAKQRFLDELQAVFDGLRSVAPPSNEQINDMEADAIAAFRRKLFKEKLEAEEQAEANKDAAGKLQSYFKQVAIENRIYCEPLVIDPSGETDRSRGGPFEIPVWTAPGNPPSTGDLWESQAKLWVYQDLVRAVQIANNYDDPEGSIVNQPIKELLYIDVEDGYVTSSSSGSSGRGRGRGNSGDGGGSVLTDDQFKNAKREGVGRHPSVSLSGRVSNALFDVKKAHMGLIVDSTRLPEVFNAIGRVNLMSVLNVVLTDVDEYEEFFSGKFYGEGVDVVKVVLAIETLWMREWTAGHNSPELADEMDQEFNPGLMPDYVRRTLNLPLRNNSAEHVRMLDNERPTSSSSRDGRGGRGRLGR